MHHKSKLKVIMSISVSTKLCVDSLDICFRAVLSKLAVALMLFWNSWSLKLLKSQQKHYHSMYNLIPVAYK